LFSHRFAFFLKRDILGDRQVQTQRRTDCQSVLQLRGFGSIKTAGLRGVAFADYGLGGLLTDHSNRSSFLLFCESKLIFHLFRLDGLHAESVGPLGVGSIQGRNRGMLVEEIAVARFVVDAVDDRAKVEVSVWCVRAEGDGDDRQRIA
jgi:hypothetical protein